MRMAYFLQGILFVGIFLIAAYALQSKKPSNSDIIGTIKQPMTTTLSIASPVFEKNGRIPSKYTCDGDRSISPPLAFSGIPEGTRSLALIMDDPDVPKVLHPDGVFDHWVLFNIPSETRGIVEGQTAGTVGANGSGVNSYSGPCPPPQYEPSEHRYVFVLYALDKTLTLKEGATKQEVLKAMEGHVMEQAELVGKYKRQ
jgi:Raf kinase inhibitor-like YbhB/YbcL family protein